MRRSVDSPTVLTEPPRSASWHATLNHPRACAFLVGKDEQFLLKQLRQE